MDKTKENQDLIQLDCIPNWEDYLPLSFKYTIVGDVNVGKTTIVQSLAYGKIIGGISHKPTIGSHFERKEIKIPGLKDSIDLHLWDISGQDRFLTYSHVFFTGTNAVVIVVDCNNFQKTLDKAREWKKRVSNNLEVPVPWILLAHKYDLINKIEEEKIEKELNQFVQENGILKWSFTSITSNMEEPFVELTKHIVEDFEKSFRASRHQSKFGTNQRDDIITITAYSQSHYSLNNNRNNRKRQSCCSIQ